MIQVCGLYYSVPTEKGPKEILRNVSFTSQDSRLAIIGPNGSGKSTLLRILGGLVKPTSGRVSFDGLEPQGIPAYLPQRAEDGLWLELTVRESLVAASSRGRLLWHGHGSWEAAKAFMPWLPQLLQDRLDARVASLSGGERQVLLLASALASSHGASINKPCLLADEFTAALDPKHEQFARAALENAYSTTLKDGFLIFVTHSLAETIQFATDVVALRNGSVSWCRPASEVTAQSFLAAYEGEPDKLS